MSDAAEVRALIAELKAAYRDPQHGVVVVSPRLLVRAHDALEAAHAEPDDEREALARILADIEPGDDWPTNGDLGGHWALGTRDDEFRAEFLERADRVIAAGFRRSARVPVSRDKLAAALFEVYDHGTKPNAYAEADEILRRIFPKADRKSAPATFVDERDPACVERWPGCASGDYDPRCCRFPKSCSADIVQPEHGTLAADKQKSCSHEHVMRGERRLWCSVCIADLGPLTADSGTSDTPNIGR